MQVSQPPYKYWNPASGAKFTTSEALLMLEMAAALAGRYERYQPSSLGLEVLHAA